MRSTKFSGFWTPTLYALRTEIQYIIHATSNTSSSFRPTPSPHIADVISTLALSLVTVTGVTVTDMGCNSKMSIEWAPPAAEVSDLGMGGVDVLCAILALTLAGEASTGDAAGVNDGCRAGPPPGREVVEVVFCATLSPCVMIWLPHDLDEKLSNKVLD